MAKKEIKSVINGIITDIYSSRTVDEAKELFIKFIDATNIKETDKQKMLEEVSKMTTLRKIQQYATNAMFKYEGLGID
jgi:hypothetical protein